MTNTPTTFFGWIIFLIQQYHGYYLQGLLTTLETSLAGTICGCFLGFLVGIIQATDIRAQDNMIKKILLGIPWVIAKIYVTIFRGTPMIVQAMVISETIQCSDFYYIVKYRSLYVRDSPRRYQFH